MNEIIVTDHGFAIWSGEAMWYVLWREVARVDAFKRDLFTTDLVCLAFTLDASTQVYEVNEEVPGFDELIETMARALPESRRNWYPEVVRGAFETQMITVFERPRGVDERQPMERSASGV